MIKIRPGLKAIRQPNVGPFSDGTYETYVEKVEGDYFYLTNPGYKNYKPETSKYQDNKGWLRFEEKKKVLIIHDSAK